MEEVVLALGASKQILFPGGPLLNAIGLTLGAPMCVTVPHALLSQRGVVGGGEPVKFQGQVPEGPQLLGQGQGPDPRRDPRRA